MTAMAVGAAAASRSKEVLILRRSRPCRPCPTPSTSTSPSLMFLSSIHLSRATNKKRRIFFDKCLVLNAFDSEDYQVSSEQAPRREDEDRKQRDFYLSSFAYTRGRNKPIDPDLADVLVNVFVIFGIAAVPWLLEDHGSHLYWIPVLFALVVFFPSVRAGAHQLTDIVTRRLDRAWRGRWGRETDEHNHYYEHRQGQQRQQQAGDEAGDADRWDRYYYRNTGEEGERRREHHQATDNASSSEKSGSNLVVNRWRERATSSGNQSRRQQKKKQQASPLFFRMLFSVFPFMRYWGGFL